MESSRMPTRRQAPTVARRRLAAEMLELRQTAGRTRDAVSADTGISQGALHRIEIAKTTPQAGTLNHLMDYYGVTDADKRAAMHELRKRSRQLKWLELFEGGTLPDSYRSFASFEADAARISGYESLFIFGLLQTHGYAETVIRAMTPEISDEEVATRLEIRMRRQEVLTSPTSPHLWVIMDEAAIRRRVGDPETYREQLLHLVALSQRPKITLQVIPFTAGAHQGMPGSFHVLEFHAEDPPMVYMENAGGGLVVETTSEVAWYRNSFQRLAAQASSPQNTVQMIEMAANAI
ncbi:transcriptional regulator [Actinoplanes italicus]|uniref:Helix-turn-helix protein n=1 Tax=Actinoplanes italicus TaxID=113567 RepID=A0A2T0JX64_9ACTN|nr:helix-turn-helix transcriptional regulator [Actinoplanes italicus]PRX12600.1 helix-turn-helix protein [Actinoplanes italicus]GIE35368.1 transcriptional regulator [Actinoplanes italicus]